MAWKFDKLTPEEKKELRQMYDANPNDRAIVPFILERKVARIGNCNSCFVATVKDWIEWAIHEKII